MTCLVRLVAAAYVASLAWVIFSIVVGVVCVVRDWLHV